RIDPDDLRAYRQDVEKTSSKLRKRYLLIHCISMVTFFLFLYFKTRAIPDVYFDELFPTYSKWFFLAYHTIIIFLIVYPLLEQGAFHNSKNTMIKKLAESSYFGERKITIDDTGVTIEQPNTLKTFKWQ